MWRVERGYVWQGAVSVRLNEESSVTQNQPSAWRLIDSIWPRVQMTSQAVYNTMQKRGQQAGVKDFSSHDFRRTLVGELLDAGADIATVQKIMGHASPTTTTRYDRRPEATKRKAANLRHTPYKGSKQPA